MTCTTRDDPPRRLTETYVSKPQNREYAETLSKPYSRICWRPTSPNTYTSETSCDSALAPTPPTKGPRSRGFRVRDSGRQERDRVLIEITEDPDSSGRHCQNSVPGGRPFPDSVPHRTLCEIAPQTCSRGAKLRRPPLPRHLLGGSCASGRSVGQTCTDIARELGWSIYTVDSWLKRARRLTRPPRHDDEVASANRARSAEAQARA